MIKTWKFMMCEFYIFIFCSILLSFFPLFPFSLLLLFSLHLPFPSFSSFPFSLLFFLFSSSHHGALAGTLSGHTSWVLSVAFSSDNQHVITGWVYTYFNFWSSQQFLSSTITNTVLHSVLCTVCCIRLSVRQEKWYLYLSCTCDHKDLHLFMLHVDDNSTCLYLPLF